MTPPGAPPSREIQVHRRLGGALSRPAHFTDHLSASALLAPLRRPRAPARARLRGRLSAVREIFRRGPDRIARGSIKLLLGQIMLDALEGAYQEGLPHRAR